MLQPCPWPKIHHTIEFRLGRIAELFSIRPHQPLKLDLLSGCRDHTYREDQNLRCRLCEEDDDSVFLRKVKIEN